MFVMFRRWCKPASSIFIAPQNSSSSTSPSMAASASLEMLELMLNFRR